MLTIRPRWIRLNLAESGLPSSLVKVSPSRSCFGPPTSKLSTRGAQRRGLDAVVFRCGSGLALVGNSEIIETRVHGLVMGRRPADTISRWDLCLVGTRFRF